MLFKTFKLVPSRVECRSLVTVEDKCFFVIQTEDCENGIGLINYLSFLYCNGDSVFIGGIFVLAVLLLFLFLGLASAANNFFCPALQVMSKKMRMSDNVAGVTLLALGNGAADIFSSLAGIRQGRAELVFGELFGAGIFVTTVVSGTICIITPFHVMERPFLRDCVFYLAAVFFVFYVFFHNYISLAHAVGFISLYIGYVVVVIVGRIVNARLNNSTQQYAEVNSTVNVEYDTVPVLEQENPVEETADETTPPSLWQSFKDEVKELLDSLMPVTLEEWVRMTWYGKAHKIFEVPFYVMLKLTVPLVDDERPRQGWCRPLKCLQMAVTPTWAVWALGYGNVMIAKILPLPLMIFMLCISFGLLVALFTQRKEEPPGHWLFAIFAFCASVLWIDLIVSEILAILFTYGVVFQLSDTILGLTILAWGNSVGDFAANIAIARQRAPRMGFSACYGAPLLNTLLGLGISFVVVCSQYGQSYYVTFQHLSMTMTIFLMLSLVIVFVYLPLSRFRADKRLGTLLFVTYAAFLMLTILEEAGVLWPDVDL